MKHRGERDDDCRQAEKSDQEAVDRTDRRAHRKRQRERGPDELGARKHGNIGRELGTAAEELDDHDVDERDHRTCGQVEAPGQDDDGLAHGGKRQGGGSGGDGAHVEIGDPFALDELQDDQHHQEHTNRHQEAALTIPVHGRQADPRPPRRRRHQRSIAQDDWPSPSAARMTAASDSASPLSVAASRPR